ncbi:MAG: class I SAM-dependent methyltransferase [Oscillospiraceae bacterium]|nr:class I SAM-dependent methyltransferase [Oscillospiraceae bacterium]
MENLFSNTARLYDFDYQDSIKADIPFYIGYAKAQGGAVLELGCGTGRVSLPLAAAGFHVTGLDLSQPMLEVFREKLAVMPRLAGDITLIHGNMADFSLGRKFPLIIIPFRAFQTLTDVCDITGALSCVRSHLEDEGIFIVDVFNPYPNMDESWYCGETVFWEKTDEKTGARVIKKHLSEKIDTISQILYPRLVFEVTYPDGKSERLEDDLKLKYYYSGQLRSVIEKAGLEITQEYSWYDKAPPGGREIIFICKKLCS